MNLSLLDTFKRQLRQEENASELNNRLPQRSKEQTHTHER